MFSSVMFQNNMIRYVAINNQLYINVWDLAQILCVDYSLLLDKIEKNSIHLCVPDIHSNDVIITKKDALAIIFSSPLISQKFKFWAMKKFDELSSKYDKKNVMVTMTTNAYNYVQNSNDENANQYWCNRNDQPVSVANRQFLYNSNEQPVFDAGRQFSNNTNKQVESVKNNNKTISNYDRKMSIKSRLIHNFGLVNESIIKSKSIIIGKKAAKKYREIYKKEPEMSRENVWKDMKRNVKIYTEQNYFDWLDDLIKENL